MKTGKVDKPKKPRPDFPLFPHASGRWAKKVRGQFCYFGPWANPEGALQRWLDEKDDLLGGRKPRKSGDEFTVRDLVNQFLTAKKSRVPKLITPQTFTQYHSCCARIIQAFGPNRVVADIRPSDFEKLHTSMASSLGTLALTNEIYRVRGVFRYASDMELVAKTVKFPPDFRKPSDKVVRRDENEREERILEADEIRGLIGAASVPMRAMILLGINCGFGNHDVASLPFKALDLDGSWVNHPRPKTAIKRRCPLWPETVTALHAAMAMRPDPIREENQQLVFITWRGNPYVRLNDRNVWTDAVGLEFAKLLRALDLKRTWGSFYILRHMLETIGGDSRDQVAVNHIMGHCDSTMAGVYRERIEDARLKAVTNHVHAWLFPKAKPAARRPAKKVAAKRSPKKK